MGDLRALGGKGGEPDCTRTVVGVDGNWGWMWGMYLVIVTVAT